MDRPRKKTRVPYDPMARHARAEQTERAMGLAPIAPRPRKKNPGRNVREGERNTIAVKLRLPHDVAEDLDDLATARGLTRSGVVAELVEAATDDA